MIDHAQVRALVGDGLSTEQIAARLGVTSRSIRRVRAELGIAEPVGAPATGERPRLPSPRVDVDVAEAVTDEAAARGEPEVEVVARVVTRWARRRR